MPLSESSVFSDGLERGQRACHRVRYAERFENPISVGHVSRSCLLEDVERVFGQCRIEAAMLEPGDDVSLLGNGSFI
jgi:hypothetical protein